MVWFRQVLRLAHAMVLSFEAMPGLCCFLRVTQSLSTADCAPIFHHYHAHSRTDTLHIMLCTERSACSEVLHIGMFVDFLDSAWVPLCVGLFELLRRFVMMALGSLSLPPHCIVQLSFACIFCWIARVGSRVLLSLPLLLRGIHRYENKEGVLLEICPGHLGHAGEGRSRSDQRRVLPF